MNNTLFASDIVQNKKVVSSQNNYKFLCKSLLFCQIEFYPAF